MSTGPRLDLGRPRAVGELFGDALAVYARNLGRFLLIALAIVVPVHLVVSGIGLEWITAPYREEPSVAERVIPTVVSFFVVAPLITASAIHALEAVGRGERPGTGRSLQAGLDAFSAIFPAVLLAAAGVALGLAALIVPGVYLLIRWYFIPQAVMLEEARGAEPLRRSAGVVEGFWWRAFGVVVLANLAVVVPGLLVLTPLEGAAESADRQALSLAGTIAADAVTAPFVALVSTLLYHDLRARRSRTQMD